MVICNLYLLLRSDGDVRMGGMAVGGGFVLGMALKILRVDEENYYVGIKKWQQIH